MGREFDPGLVPYFLEIDHEIISTVILLPSADSFKKGCCQLKAKVCPYEKDSLPQCCHKVTAALWQRNSVPENCADLYR